MMIYSDICLKIPKRERKKIPTIMTPSGSAKPERVANLKACHLLLNKSIEK